MKEVSEISNRIVSLYKTGKIDKIEMLYQQLPAELQENHAILYKIYKIYFSLRKFDKAEELIIKAIKSTNSLYYFKDLGQINYALGDYKRANECYLQVLKQCPTT